MASIPNTFASLRPTAPSPRVELGKPVTSVTSIASAAARPIVFQRRKVAPVIPRISNLLALAREPEDARITGGTRSLDRRLLALNLSGSRSRGVLLEN